MLNSHMWRVGLHCVCRWLLAGLLLDSFAFCFGAPIISEFMAVNGSVLTDEDGDYSDWLEIYNPENTPVSLEGCHLTDDAANLGKWTFPPMTLDPGACLIVFASGKNRTDPAGRLHTSFHLSAQGEYLALVAPDRQTVVSAFAPAYPPQFENVSFGMGQSRASSLWSFFPTPTPGTVNGSGIPAGPIVRVLVPNPPQPVSGPVIVTATVLPVNDSVAMVSLYYRHMFAPEVMVVMKDDGSGGDARADDGVWTASIPAEAFTPGQMTRWRFVAADRQGAETREPAFHDPLDSPQYFGTVTQDSTIKSALPVFHWFTSDPAGAETAAGSRGAVYYEGEFYDNVRFRLHGQSAASYPKKSFNVAFNPAEHLLWNPAADRVSDIDLLTNWVDKSKVRQVLAYEIMRLSGVGAHFAYTVRVQQNGTFFSTADIVENADETYLERAGLNKNGALYKVYNNLLNKEAGDTGAAGVEKKTRKNEDNTDLQALIEGLDLTGPALTNYLYDNIDIPACVNLLAVNSVIRSTDMQNKNWYIYRDTGRSGEWALLPWDLELTFGRTWISQDASFDNALYADGFVATSTDIRLVKILFTHPDIRAMIFRRIRTLSDRFLQPPPAAGTPESEFFFERWLNEQSALIDPADIIPSDARLDFEKWGSWLQGGATVSCTNSDPAVETMAQAITRLKTEYLPARRDYIYNTQTIDHGGDLPLPQAGIVRTPAGDVVQEPQINFGVIEVNPASGNQDEEFIQLVNSNSIAVDISGWRLSGSVEHTFPGGTVLPTNGSIYLSPNASAFRSRTTSPKGGEGLLVQGGYKRRLSNTSNTLVLLNDSGMTNNAVDYPARPSLAQQYLVISEIMYHPAGDGLSEFIELMNISDSATLDLRGVRFTQGVEFDFTNSAITLLPPGGRVVVVRDLAAFTAIYGTNRPVAGVFANGTALSNGGEIIKLEDSASGIIQEFAYNDQPPWPTDADEDCSLVLLAPETKPDPAIPTNWRASLHLGGNPGWPDIEGFPLDPMGDANNNGERDLIDYALGNDSAQMPVPMKLALEQSLLAGPASLLLSYPLGSNTANVKLEVVCSTNMLFWQNAAACLELVSTNRLADGRTLTTWRVTAPLCNAPQFFLRLRAVAN